MDTIDSIINGLENSFKPCFKWLLPKIEEFECKYHASPSVESFKPCFKWLLPKMVVLKKKIQKVSKWF